MAAEDIDEIFSSSKPLLPAGHIALQAALDEQRRFPEAAAANNLNMWAGSAVQQTIAEAVNDDTLYKTNV